MSRPWIKVHVECLDNPKIVTLSLSLRGIWYTTLLIAERYNKDGLLPSADRFAVMAHTDDETVNKAFLALAKKGLLDESPEGYRVHDWAEWQVRKPSDEPDAVLARVRKHRGQPSPDVTPRNALQDVTETVTPRNAGNAVKSEKREEETREELTHKGELTTHLAAEPRERVVYLPAFEIFWKAYGKFVGKKEAHQYWLKLKPDTVLLATILAAVEGQRGGRKWLEGYQPDAVRWLKGEHWNDIPEAPRPAPAPVARRTSADERMERIQTDGDAAYEIITQMEARKHGRSDLSPTNRLTGGALPADRDERDASRVVDFPRRSIG